MHNVFYLLRGEVGKMTIPRTTSHREERQT